MKLPILALLLVSASCSAADYVTLTLKDGRVLTGFYEKDRLSMEDGKIVLPINRDEVVTVAQADVPVAPIHKVESKPRPTIPMAKEADDFRTAQEKVRSLHGQMQIAQAELEAARVAAITKFLKVADLSPVKITVSDTPSPEEVQRVGEVSRFNRELDRVRAGARPESQEFYSQYARLKNAAWVPDFSH